MSFELVVTDDFGYSGYVFRKGEVITDDKLFDEIERLHRGSTVRRALPDAAAPAPVIGQLKSS